LGGGEDKLPYGSAGSNKETIVQQSAGGGWALKSRKLKDQMGLFRRDVGPN
jgi:hypothetical protein